MAIVYDSKQECSMVLHQVNIDWQDSSTYNNKHVMNPFIFWGNLTDPPELMTVHLKDTIVKVAYSKQKVFHFYQYPNTVESTGVNIALFSFLQRYLQLLFSEKFVMLSSQYYLFVEVINLLSFFTSVR